MTTTEFNTELDIIYENINKNGAPGLDAYEKSVILTHAEELFVKESIKAGGEEMFPNLIANYSTSSVLAGSYGLNSYEFPIASSYIKILNEYLMDATSEVVTLIPISSAEFQMKKSKPYAYPQRRTAWRLGLDNTSAKISAFVRDGYIPTIYRSRYIRKPLPIILANLATLTPAASIDGLTAITECELDANHHRDILKIAATLAEQYYMDKYNTGSNES